MPRRHPAQLLCILVSLLGGCAGYEPGPDTYLFSYGRTTNPQPTGFVHCYDFTCRTTVNTLVTEDELARIGAPFATPSRDAREERRRIRLAIALWEQVVGARTGTAADVGSESGDKWGGRFQQDCMDETFNTTAYLMMMEQAGWLKFHRVVYPSSRGFISAAGLPHHAATIEEAATRRRFVVDSWFLDNGRPAVVMPVEIWEKGWSPSQTGGWREE